LKEKTVKRRVMKFYAYHSVHRESILKIGNNKVLYKVSSCWNFFKIDEEVFLIAEPPVQEPSQEEMEKAICNLKTNKAPGEDNIIAELIENASRELKKRLYALICKILKDEKMPDDWKVGLIVRLFKKGDKMKCENYRGITLLNVAYKILSSIILEWLKEYSEGILGEYNAV
jgi:hypothetical protein